MAKPTADVRKDELQAQRALSFIIRQSARQLGVEVPSARPLHLLLEAILVAAAASPGVIQPEAYRLIMILHDAARKSDDSLP